MDEISLERRAAMAALVAGRTDDLLIVPGLGSTTWDLVAAGDDPRNFYLWGAMGGAAMIGLGLALAQPNKRVAVITGDGEMLMGLGALATIGVQKPANLAVIVFDNGLYGETGGQPSHTQGGVDLLGRGACGIGPATTSPTSRVGDLAVRLKDFGEMLFARVAIEARSAARSAGARRRRAQAAVPRRAWGSQALAFWTGEPAFITRRSVARRFRRSAPR